MIPSILNAISMLCTFIVANGVVYFLMNITIGKTPILNRSLFGAIKVKSLLAIAVTLLLISEFATFHRPW